VGFYIEDHQLTCVVYERYLASARGGAARALDGILQEAGSVNRVVERPEYSAGTI